MVDIGMGIEYLEDSVRFVYGERYVYQGVHGKNSIEVPYRSFSQLKKLSEDKYALGFEPKEIIFISKAKQSLVFVYKKAERPEDEGLVEILGPFRSG